MDYLQKIWDTIADLENDHDPDDALRSLNELDSALRCVQRELGEEIVLVPMTRKDACALEQATTEYSFSTEPGGVNEGDEQADENLKLLSGVAGRFNNQLKPTE